MSSNNTDKQQEQVKAPGATSPSNVVANHTNSLDAPGALRSIMIDPRPRTRQGESGSVEVPEKRYSLRPDFEPQMPEEASNARFEPEMKNMWNMPVGDILHNNLQNNLRNSLLNFIGKTEEQEQEHDNMRRSRRASTVDTVSRSSTENGPIQADELPLEPEQENENGAFGAQYEQHEDFGQYVDPLIDGGIRQDELGPGPEGAYGAGYGEQDDALSWVERYEDVPTVNEEKEDIEIEYVSPAYDVSQGGMIRRMEEQAVEERLGAAQQERMPEPHRIPVAPIREELAQRPAVDAENPRPPRLGDDFTQWTVEEMADWVMDVTNSEKCRAIIIAEEFDGSGMKTLVHDVEVRGEAKFPLWPFKKMKKAAQMMIEHLRF